MKRILCITAAVLLIVALLCGCSSNEVKTKVDAQYVDGFADGYADKVNVSSDGSVSYVFSKDGYEEFLTDYLIKVREDFRQDITSVGQYSYLSPDGTEMVIGVMPDSYDEALCRAEAEVIAQDAMKYNMNTSNPTGKISVRYENCNTGEEYFTVEIAAE